MVEATAIYNSIQQWLWYARHPEEFDLDDHQCDLCLYSKVKVGAEPRSACSVCPLFRLEGRGCTTRPSPYMAAEDAEGWGDMAGVTRAAYALVWQLCQCYPGCEEDDDCEAGE